MPLCGIWPSKNAVQLFVLISVLLQELKKCQQISRVLQNMQEYLLEILLMTLRICLCQPIRENWQFPISGKTAECFARYFAIVLQAPHEIKRDTAVLKISIVFLNQTHHGPWFTTHSYIFVIQYCLCVRQHLFILSDIIS